jgi:hypothetical protein
MYTCPIPIPLSAPTYRYWHTVIIGVSDGTADVVDVIYVNIVT